MTSNNTKRGMSKDTIEYGVDECPIEYAESQKREVRHLGGKTYDGRSVLPLQGERQSPKQPDSRDYHGDNLPPEADKE